MSFEALPSDQVQSRLELLEQWTLDDGKLYREFRFADFSEAFAFMTRSAIEAEKQDHHPEWFNVWNKVRVHLTTHSAQGITERDFKLAETMDRLAGG